MATKMERAITALRSLANNVPKEEIDTSREIDSIIDILNEHSDYDIVGK